MRWVIAAFIVYGLLVWFAARSLYFPVKFPEGDWQAASRIAATDVFLDSGGGTRIHGWLIRSTASKWLTLHFHGNGGNLTHRLLPARHILEAGSSVLLLDYRGYGRSEGRPTERGLYADARAAYDYARSLGFPPERIVIYGESLGTAVAVQLASERPCAGLVLEAPFPSARAVAGRVVPLIGPLLVWGFDSKSRISSLRVPILIIHGDQDEVIPYDLGKHLFEAARMPKALWTVSGAGHNDLHVIAAREYPERLRAFYSTLEQ